MPNVRLTWQNNSTGHDGQRVRMDEPSSDGPDTVIADIGPNVEEYIALSATEPEACFTVAAYDGGGEEESAVACVETVEGTDWGSVSIGDYVEGGVYAGIITYTDAREFRIISGLSDSIAFDIQWRTATGGESIADDYDGVANTDLALSSTGTWPAFSHCAGHVDAEGNTDYHFAAIEELRLVWSNLRTHAEYSDLAGSSINVLSSTEHNSSSAKALRFDIGFNHTNSPSKTASLRVLPIRRIPV